MPNPIKTCVLCGEEFELLTNKPGLSNQCPACVAPKRPDPRLVVKANRADEMAAVEVKVDESRMNNDPHDVKIAMNRLNKLKAKHSF